MQIQRFAERAQLRLMRDERLFASIVGYAAANGIGYAALSGLGAVSWISIAYFNVETREYEVHEIEEQLEVTSLVGNITIREGKPTVHAHVTLGRRDLSVIGGHVIEAIARPTLEVWLDPQPTAITRLPDEDSGLFLMDLPDRWPPE